ncbi:MAG: type I-F CRISPR-associated helicase Cas3f [Methylotenera sp.]|nr:type I-F CRISPR-associated helicase Cas3f [Methylotenera sp.]
MIVTFVSQCQKKALNRTRRVLDAFANRIGDNTWQTVITEDGLIAVKKLLRKTASKNTAVSCHWVRSRARSELVWVVGNRSKFNAQGIVPVNTTQKELPINLWENNWRYLPIIKSLVAVAALLHDWGKASALFQEKLQKASKESDPLRHEWVSCLLLIGLVELSDNFDDDAGWLTLLIDGSWNESSLKHQLVSKKLVKQSPFTQLPPLAQMVAWLIVSHHRLPNFKGEDSTKYSEAYRPHLKDILTTITAEWGYQNPSDDKRLAACFEFPHGLLNNAAEWQRTLKKWSGRLLEEQNHAKEILENGAWRVVLHHARLSLMLGDHFYSSCEQDAKWQTEVNLYANTMRNDEKQMLPKQKLDEHLVRVSDYGLKVSQSLSRFSHDMESAHDVIKLKQKSPTGYEWQDKAVSAISKLRSTHSGIAKNGWFIVNMASTGCGKTIANAKIMRALSEDADSLRFILALGLRTLTLQTGDEYRDNIGLANDELAVLIGSSAVLALHSESKQNQQKDEFTLEDAGAESSEELLKEDLDDYEIPQDSPTADFLNALIPMRDHTAKAAQKNKAFLYKPVLACTIDHIIAATETTRGGRYILPCLRLLSSDLVIDEVDDFDGQDLVAIGRLIHLAAMLGRKVMISSATIPPSLAEGFFNVYQEGWRLHQRFMNAPQEIHLAWVDEFQTEVATVSVQTNVLENNQQYQGLHQSFIQKRVAQLHTQPIKRKASIVRFADYQTRQLNPAELEQATQAYFTQIQTKIVELHSQHHTIDAISQKRVSFGIVRVANIPPCVALTQYLLNATWQIDITPKAMAYHSRQVLLLRHEQEKHLDSVLKRKEKAGEIASAFKNTIIREHIDSADNNDIIFILVATPVEEVGRDHDFDWAVIEPSSYRSIIQLAGRVKRHRNQEVTQPNIAIMQYNLKAIKNDVKAAAFLRPGFEPRTPTKSLKYKNIDALLDESAINQAINAIPRIQTPETLKPREQLADLEHQALKEKLTSYNAHGPKYLQAWLSESWWLTAMPQRNNRFRESAPDIAIYYCWHEGELAFHLKTDRGVWAKCQATMGIQPASELSEIEASRLWLKRDYESILRKRCEIESEQMLNEELMKKLERESKRFGEITIPEQKKDFFYSDNYGLYY